MPNPIAVATQGKGVFSMLRRGRSIVGRYGFTAAKMATALARLADILDNFACRATIPVTASPLERHAVIAQKYQAQGWELAVHGLVHVDCSQLVADDQLDHLKQAQGIFNQVGIQAVGFRCPYLRWNADTLTALSDCGFAYDSSQALAWDVTGGLEMDAYRRVLEFYGAQSASDYPALPRMTNGLVRIPYCLPDDEALVERLHLAESQAMAEIWLAMLERIYQSSELFTLGLHPERVLQCQGALQAVLKKARSLSPPVWIARLDEIAAWHRALGQASFETRVEDGDHWWITVNAPPEAVILIRSLDVTVANRPWAGGFRCISESEFTLRSEKRPFIGVSPDCPPALSDFLRHQGYLIEISPDPQAYVCYLHRSRFDPEDERSLLTELEQGEWPLVRLGRWPGGARCGLAVTGDVDAFTLWDYGLRIWGK